MLLLLLLGRVWEKYLWKIYSYRGEAVRTYTLTTTLHTCTAVWLAAAFASPKAPERCRLVHPVAPHNLPLAVGVLTYAYVDAALGLVQLSEYGEAVHAC